MLRALGFWGGSAIFLNGFRLSFGSTLGWIYGVLGLVLGIWGLRPALKAFSIWRERRDIVERRLGLLVQRDALVFRDGSEALRIPRNADIRVQDAAPDADKDAATLHWKLKDGSEGHRELPKVSSLESDDLEVSEDTGSLKSKLENWQQTGNFEPSPEWHIPVRRWVRDRLHNAFWGHVLLQGVAVCWLGMVAMASLAVASLALPGGMLSMLGILLAVPLFLGFPMLVKTFIDGRLIYVGKRPAVWGYLMILGLSALFFSAVGSETVSVGGWQLRADTVSPQSASEIIERSGRPTYYLRNDGLRNDGLRNGGLRNDRLQVLESPLGMEKYSRRYSGETTPVQWAAFALPVADADDVEPGCLWLAMHLPYDTPPEEGRSQLLDNQAPAWVEAVNLDSASLDDAVADAQAELPEGVESCAEPVIVTPSPLKSDAIAATGWRLAFLHLVLHGLPMLVLGLWMLWFLDRRPLVAQRY